MLDSSPTPNIIQPIKKSYYKGHENGLLICENYVKAKNIKKKEKIQIQIIKNSLYI